MHEEVRSILKKHFPGPDFEYPDPDEIASGEVIDEDGLTKIVEALQSRGYRVDLTIDENSGVCFELNIFPSLEIYQIQVALLERKLVRGKTALRILNEIGGVGYYEYFEISRVAAYVYSMSMKFFIHDGEVDDCIIAVPGDESARKLRTDFLHLLEGYGYKSLSDSELLEPVPWLRVGDSVLLKSPVTVYNCLFSELGGPKVKSGMFQA